MSETTKVELSTLDLVIIIIPLMFIGVVLALKL